MDSMPMDSDGGESGKTSASMMLICHVVCGALATMLFFPLGVLIPRYARGLGINRWWFPVHGAVNGVLGLVFVMAAFGIAVVHFEDDGGIMSSTHRKSGLALAILVIVQVFLGIASHWIKPAVFRLRGRAPTNYLHVLLGVAIVALGWETVYQGITVEWALWSGIGPASHNYVIAWAVCVAVPAFAYVAGLALLPRQLRMEEEARNKSDGVMPLADRKNGPLRGSEQTSDTGAMP